MNKLTLVLIPPRISKTTQEIGDPTIACYDPNDSTVRDKEGNSLMPSTFPFIRELDEMPGNVLKIMITPDNCMKLFEILPSNISKTPFCIIGSKRFDPEGLKRLTFVLYHQLLSNPRTPAIPYFNYRIKEHLRTFVLGRKAPNDWSQPLETADDAINFAFWLMAVQVVTNKIVVLIHDPLRGPLELPSVLQQQKNKRHEKVIDLTQYNKSRWNTPKEAIEVEKRLLLEDKRKEDQCLKELPALKDKDPKN